MAARGDGESLGRALISALAEAAGGTVGVKTSYTAKGWHAQISKITSQPRGYEAAEAVGLSATADTLKAWLSESREPTAANQRLIAAAYERMRGRWPAEVERGPIEVTGQIETGRDDRTRTVELTESREWSWTRLKRRWETGDLDPDEVEDDFVEDVWEGELGEGSEGWDFPGGSYTVVIG
ncbi:hypothetical protein ABTY59_37420 [Streptomyces sp. NPDC096079]|uniref:hypothetical protein n=1 Tax=Streptomyces sp. NPDC096079 TaxID=3155820 RepID=UPI00333070BD